MNLLENKSKKISLYVTDKEYNKLKENAMRYSLNLTEYCKFLSCLPFYMDLVLEDFDNINDNLMKIRSIDDASITYQAERKYMKLYKKLQNKVKTYEDLFNDMTHLIKDYDDSKKKRKVLEEIIKK